MPSAQETQFSELIARFYPLIDALRGSMGNVQNLVSLLTTAGGQWWRNRADMDVGPQPPEGTPAIVWNDPVVANRGLYVRLGDPLTGSWESTGYIFGSSVPLALLDPDVFESFRADVTQVIGRTGVPVAGNPVAGSAYIQAAPVAHASPLARLPVKLVAPGDLMVARYIVNADQTQIRRQETAVIPVADIGDGNKVFTQAHFGVINFNPGDLIGLSGAGMFTASPDFPVDGPGWRQINPLLDDWRPMPALQAAIRLEYSAEFDQHIQVVNGPDFLAVEAQAADVDARATVLEEQAARLWTDRVQVIGNPDALVPGDGVSGGLYVWADQNEHVGPLLSLDVMPAAAGDFDLVKEYRVDNKLYRNLLVTLTAAQAGVEQRFLPAHFGNIIVAQGEYLALHGPGVIAATTEPADGSGFWDVPGWPATPRDIPAVSAGHRLQARFRIQQQYQAVDAEKVFEIEGDIAALAEQVASVGAGVKDTLTVPSPASLDPTAPARQAPMFGGKNGMFIPRSKGKRCVAHLSTVADVFNGVSIPGLANVVDPQSPFGLTALQLTTTGVLNGPIQYLAPLAAQAYPANANGMIMEFMARAVSNVKLSMDRAVVELFSSGVPGNGPPGTGGVPNSYHRLPVGDFTSHFTALMTSPNGLGRWQKVGIPVSAFEAVNGGATLGAITWARIGFRAANGATISVRVGGVNFVKNLLSKAVLHVSFDDGYLTQYTVNAPMLTKRGMRGMFYASPVATSIGVSASTYMTAQHLIQAHDVLEFQIAGQAYDTETAAIIDAMTHNERVGWIGAKRNWDNSLGLGWGTQHGSWFSGVGPQDIGVFEAFRTHFRSMRAFNAGQTADNTKPPFAFPETYPYSDPWAIRALNAATYTGPDAGVRLVQHLQQAADHNGLAHLAYHNEAGVPGNVQNGLAYALDWALANPDKITVETEEHLPYLAAY